MYWLIIIIMDHDCTLVIILKCKGGEGGWGDVDTYDTPPTPFYIVGYKRDFMLKVLKVIIYI